jgi:hypothetical protein
LGAAEVTLGRLHRNVTEEELNLLQFAAGCATESIATPLKIVRRKFAHSDFRRELLDNVPSRLLRHPFAPTFPGLLTRRKRRPPVIPAPLHPVIEETAHPARDRDGSNVAPLPTQVNDCPMAFDVAESGRLSGLRVHGAEVREPQEQQVMPDLVCP